MQDRAFKIYSTFKCGLECTVLSPAVGKSLKVPQCTQAGTDRLITMSVIVLGAIQNSVNIRLTCPTELTVLTRIQA